MAGACNPSYLGGWGRRITWTQEVEVAMSRDCTTALQPGDRMRLRLKKKKKERITMENFFPSNNASVWPSSYCEADWSHHRESCLDNHGAVHTWRGTVIPKSYLLDSAFDIFCLRKENINSLYLGFSGEFWFRMYVIMVLVQRIWV